MRFHFSHKSLKMLKAITVFDFDKSVKCSVCFLKKYLNMKYKLPFCWMNLRTKSLSLSTSILHLSRVARSLSLFCFGSCSSPLILIHLVCRLFLLQSPWFWAWQSMIGNLIQRGVCTVCFGWCLCVFIAEKTLDETCVFLWRRQEIQLDIVWDCFLEFCCIISAFYHEFIIVYWVPSWAFFVHFFKIFLWVPSWFSSI